MRRSQHGAWLTTFDFKVNVNRETTASRNNFRNHRLTGITAGQECCGNGERVAGDADSFCFLDHSGFLPGQTCFLCPLDGCAIFDLQGRTSERGQEAVTGQIARAQFLLESTNSHHT